MSSLCHPSRQLSENEQMTLQAKQIGAKTSNILILQNMANMTADVCFCMMIITSCLCSTQRLWEKDVVCKFCDSYL